jgi:predicted membrane chloride channel (bestrophin family)
MTHILFRKNILLLKAVPIVLVLILLKLFLHYQDYELLTLNPIFSGIIGANVFLMGFLLSGVFADYKESEKLPAELSSCLYNISDDILTMRCQIPWENKKEFHRDLLIWAKHLHSWFYKDIKTRELLNGLDNLNRMVIELERNGAIPTQLARIRTEQGNLRKYIIRIHTIRETDFIPSGYLIACSSSCLLIIGMLLSKIEPFYESLFFVGVICYLLIFLLFLIRDLDNPFGHYEINSSEDVSLYPLVGTIDALEKRCND